MVLTTGEIPDLFWCLSLGPVAQNGAPWRCVLDDGHDGMHQGAGNSMWLTADETGQAVQEQP
jgi:hypothetical protein